jgi:hypothetical protein
MQPNDETLSACRRPKELTPQRSMNVERFVLFVE